MRQTKRHLTKYDRGGHTSTTLALFFYSFIYWNLQRESDLLDSGLSNNSSQN